MSTQGSTLIAHCGAQKVTREELKTIPVPVGTKTHQPLSHFEIVEVLEEALSFRYLKVTRDEYAVSADGMKMFGVMDLNTGFDGGNFSIGLRNSNDKSMRLALTAGLKVTVCDNMAFSGDFTPLLHKHTRNLELKDSISIAVDRIQRGFKPLEQRIAEMKQYGLTDNDARILIYGVFIEQAIKGIPKALMPSVHEHYFEPKHEEFAPRTLWSLSNAFTSAFKQLSPMKQFEMTARLGTFLTQVQAHSKRRPEDPEPFDRGRVEDFDQHEPEEVFEPVEGGNGSVVPFPQREPGDIDPGDGINPIQPSDIAAGESADTPLNNESRQCYPAREDDVMAEIMENIGYYYDGEEDEYHDQEQEDAAVEEFQRQMAA